MRRLRPGEDAYRLVCRQRGSRCESLSDSADVVRALVACASPEFVPLRLDTVALDAAGVPSTVDCLWSADSEEDPAGARASGAAAAETL